MINATQSMDWPWWTSILPAAAAALGLLIALILLRWAVRVLARPLVWLARLAFRVSARQDNTVEGPPSALNTAPTIARLVAALLVAAKFQPAPFLLVLSLFVSIASFVAYSLPSALIRMTGDLPEACTELFLKGRANTSTSPGVNIILADSAKLILADSAKRCAWPIRRAAMEIWVGPGDRTSMTPPGVTKTQPLEFFSFPNSTSVKDVLTTINVLLKEQGNSLISALFIAAVVLVVLYAAPLAFAYGGRIMSCLRTVRLNGSTAILFYKSVGLTGLFCLALYICITAIVAIPIMNSETVDLQGLGTSLQDDLTKFRKAYPVPEIQEIDVKSLPQTECSIETSQEPQTKCLRAIGRNLIDKYKTRASQKLSSPESVNRVGQSENQSENQSEIKSEIKSEIQSEIQSEIDAKGQSAENWLDLQLDLLNDLVTRIKISVTALHVARSDWDKAAERFASHLDVWFVSQNRGHIGKSLTEEHVSRLSNDYGAWLFLYRSNVVGCSDQLDALAKDAVSRKDEIISVLNEGLASDYRTSFFDRGKLGSAAVEAEVDACRMAEQIVPNVSQFMPSRENVTASLGPFGRATAWLLQTEKRDLALIVGLLGFGLFGALASSFIRRAQSNEPLADMAVVLPALIRGVAAALVIFLAVFGGLAVFTSSGAAPNPYVVFFACFIAAVFSEDVWDWARRRQSAQLGANEASSVKTSAENKTTTQAGSPPGTAAKA